MYNANVYVHTLSNSYNTMYASNISGASSPSSYQINVNDPPITVTLYPTKLIAIIIITSQSIRRMDAVTQTFVHDQDLGNGASVRRAANSHRDRIRRSLYVGSEEEQQRENRLAKQRERSSKNRALKTEEEKELFREKNNRMKRERRVQETSNQKFWRLLRRRQQRKMGYLLLSIEHEYHRSANRYGIYCDFAKTDNEAIIQLSDIGMKTVFSVFYEMLDLALSGKPIPAEKYTFLYNYGIYLPEYFFKDYIKELSYE